MSSHVTLGVISTSVTLADSKVHLYNVTDDRAVELLI